VVVGVAGEVGGINQLRLRPFCVFFVFVFVFGGSYSTLVGGKQVGGPLGLVGVVCNRILALLL
jgi:hypothetical protein